MYRKCPWKSVKVKADSLPLHELYSPWNSLGQNTVGSLSLLPGDLTDPGIKPGSPALQEDSLPTVGKSVGLCHGDCEEVLCSIPCGCGTEAGSS